MRTFFLLFRLHRMHEMQNIVTDIRSVCLSRGSSRLHCAKMAEQSNIIIIIIIIIILYYFFLLLQFAVYFVCNPADWLPYQ